MPKREPTRLRSVVRQVLRGAEASYSDRAHRVWDVWEEAVGSDLAARCDPLSLRNGRLVIGASTPAWLQQLSFLKETVRDSVNRALGEDLVRDVRFRIAEAQPPPRSPGPPRAPGPLPPLDEGALGAIDRELQAIPDEAVRLAVRRVRVRAEQERRVREGREVAGSPESTARPPRGG